MNLQSFGWGLAVGGVVCLIVALAASQYHWVSGQAMVIALVGLFVAEIVAVVWERNAK
jgi:hypothetical protein